MKSIKTLDKTVKHNAYTLYTLMYALVEVTKVLKQQLKYGVR